MVWQRVELVGEDSLLKLFTECDGFCLLEEERSVVRTTFDLR